MRASSFRGIRLITGITLAAALAVILLRPGIAWATEASPPDPGDAWSAWSWDPVVLLGMALAAFGYARGLVVLWKRAGVGRGVRRWRAAAFMTGLLVLFVALISPLAEIGHALFSVHMVQHLLLMMVAPPLLVLGQPQIVSVWALPRRGRLALGRWWLRATTARQLWHTLSQPLLAWSLQGITFWIWHAPPLFEAALRSDALHALEHDLFLGTSLLYWWALIQLHGRKRLGYGASVLYVFGTALQGSVLGALIMFSSGPWYRAYVASAPRWGLSPTEDQQLAGAIMWVPPGVVLLIAAAIFFLAWLRALDEHMTRLESQRASLVEAPRRSRTAGGESQQAAEEDLVVGRLGQ